MSRAWWLVIAVIVVSTAACTWWLSSDVVSVAPVGGAPAVDVVPVAEFVRTAPGAEPEDAGVGRVSGRVTLEDGTPVAGAEVTIHLEAEPTEDLECGVCHEHVLDCADPATARRVLAGLRDGTLRRGAPALRTVTDASGAFAFEAAPWGRELRVSSPRGSVIDETRGEPLELTVSDDVEEDEPLKVFDPAGEPVAGARVTGYDPRSGAFAELVTDATGEARVPPGLGEAWFGVEAPGCQPIGGRYRVFTVSPPLALTVRTSLGGKPVDADLELAELHRAQPLRTKDGVLRLEGLSPGLLRVKASTATLTSAEQAVELTTSEGEVRLELLAGAKLLVTAVTESGEPLESVSADLSGVVQSVNAGANAEQGALLVLGPVPEGEYRLLVNADGFVAHQRTLDLKPGETSLEVTLRPAPLALGKVVDASGAPVPMAHVEVLDGEVALTSTYTDDDGTFSMPLEQPGSYRVLAEHALTGKGEAPLTSPGPVATVTLRPGAAVEAEVFDVDGAAVAADVVLRSEASVIGVLEPVPESLVVRRAGLEAGKYLLTLSRPDRVPVNQPVEVRTGQTVRVALRLQEGAVVRGRVVTASGAPVEDANVFASDHDGTATTDEQGRFELKGLRAGPVELYGFTTQGAPLAEQKLAAPARDVVLTVKAGRNVKGRTVDARGTPLAGVRVNDLSTTGADGRFEVELHDDALLEFYLEGYLLTVRESPAADLGDVTLERAAKVEGEVVDAQGRPVSGASVRSATTAEATSTDAAGRFSLTMGSSLPPEVLASRGPLFGRAAVSPGAVVRVVLGQGTRVVGQVLGLTEGRGTTVEVFMTGGVLPPQQVETDPAGRFELTLAEGVWSFTARSDRTTRNVQVRGARLELTLGDGPRECGLVVSSPEPIVSFMLLPPGSAPEAGGAGSFDFGGRRQDVTLTARSVPCGDYVAEVLLRSGLVRQPVTVREKAQPLRLDLAFLQADSPVLVLP